MLVIDSWRERHRVKPGVTVRLLKLISFIKAISYEAQCHTGAQCNSISEFLSEAQCHAGLDPASFPQKELLEKDTGASPVRQNLRDWKVFILCPGLAYRKWVVISFIKTMLFRSSMSCRSLMIF